MKKTTLTKSLTFFIALFCAVNFGYGQEIASFSSLQNTGCSGTIASDANIITTGICRGPGIGLNAGGTYNSNNWTTSTTLDSNDYLEWTLTPNSGYQIDLSTMDITYDRSPTGPQMVDIRVDTGSGFTSIFTDASVSDPAEDNNGIDLSSITGITGTITFRLYAFSAGAAGGTFDIEENTATNKGIIINGVVSAVTCAGGTVTWNGTWSGTPDITTEVIIDADYNSAINGNFSACSLTVNAGSTLTVGNNSFIEVEYDVNVDGDLIVETQGNFVQNDDLGTFTVNAGGVARVNKQTPAKAQWYYYTYWSSPVVGEVVGDAFPFAPGDRRFRFIAANYLDADGNDIDDNGDDWQIVSSGDVLAPGVGYAATESRFHIPGGSGTASFEGSFNTGDVPTGISYNAANIAGSWNFIGNPYPGALDFDAFYLANATEVSGAAYLWSQATPPDNSNPGNQEENFSLNDYAIYTFGSGGTAGASTIIPTQYIPSAQGFFIASLPTTSGSVTFTNAMRMADGTSNSQFFKSSNTKKTSTANRLWVNLTSDNGVFNQILVAYVDGATNDDDGFLYDAPKLLTQDYAAALYSTMDSSVKKFAIQGKAASSLNTDEIIKLGFNTNINVATLYTLSLAQFEGDFLNSNPVFLKDNLLNTVHELSASDYTFTSETGEFKDRFEVVFSAASLSTDEVALNSKALKIVELDDDNVQFTTSNNLSIKSVSIFDLLGRQLYDFKGNNTSETYKLSNLSSTIYIAKVKLSNGTTITKKAIKK
ncbi:T9SS sorting signal type C domain-containing protein [Flaviramulus sp. BrNp1-15]|uniref:T9SS sorting signal type C domain-containing protein n=1 Tax=Flaviramulus sp. BrNp1-15 TaxID=2916754 RepID=UPI001EE917EE|nr:T9SS sorting signal type C domain-containing protein [Flaviramulus sp. BrNp1-15]ULC59892.1 T9SS sorting signal type C domain-containing protein [Flaviramulus sp. BrNp1-15]